jgi:hypothetical protein
MDDNRKKALSAALGQIEKQFGKGSVMRLGDASAAMYEVEAVSTGSLGLDVALGIGGLPGGTLHALRLGSKTDLGLRMLLVIALSTFTGLAVTALVLRGLSRPQAAPKPQAGHD